MAKRDAVHVTITINKDVKNNFKMFCLKKGMTMSEYTEKMWKIVMGSNENKESEVENE